MTDHENKNLNNPKSGEKKAPSTTGHDWDGISEYNIPAPRWWLIVWVISIIWALGYWVLYPTWPVPGGHTKGALKWSGVSQLHDSQMEISEKRDAFLAKIAESDFDQIQKSPELMEFALNGGRSAFKENCSACHGTGAQGAKGFPNLNDDDWLWGGKVSDIYQTIKYGVRSSHDKSRTSQMPSFGIDKILTKEQIADVVEYVMSLSDKNSPVNEKGREIFKANCVACHGANGQGDRTVGAPNLTDAIWLYNGTKEDILFTVTYAHAGVMPFWVGRLDDVVIKQLALYVHSLGGGEK